MTNVHEVRFLSGKKVLVGQNALEHLRKEAEVVYCGSAQGAYYTVHYWKVMQ